MEGFAVVVRVCAQEHDRATVWSRQKGTFQGGLRPKTRPVGCGWELWVQCVSTARQWPICEQVWWAGSSSSSNDSSRYA